MNIGDIQIQASGNVVSDPEIRFTPNGAAVAKFRIACTPRRMNRQTNQFEDQETTFLDVEGWRGLAENVSETLKKGSTVTVIGSFRVRPYEDREGNKRTAQEIYEALIAVDLTFQTAEITKVSRNAGAGGRAPAQQQQRPPAAQQQQQSPPAAARPAGSSSVVDEPPF